MSDPLYNGSSIFAKEDQSNTGIPAIEESDIIFGDLDSDGAADLTDLSTLSLFLIGDTILDDARKKAADVDGDGEVKLADLAKFRQFLSKQIETLGPERQESETGDIQKLRSEYPEYFGLETFKGLEVYAWRDNSGEYCSVLMEGTNRNKEIEEITELRPLTIEEAKLIVNDYKVNKDDVIVIPIGLNSEKQLDFETDKESSDRITSYFKNDALLSITDLTVTNGIATDSAFEVFYEDDEYTYSFSTVKSEYVECTFIDGSKMKIKDALNKGSVNLSDLDLFGILYVKDEKTDSSEVSPLDKYFYDNNLQSYAEATVFERVEIDIDKDGKTEDCTFSSGITSGLYTVIISAYSDGNLKYRNTLNLCYYSHITFVESDGDVYLMRCNDESSSDNEAVMNKIYIENDCIVVDGLDEYEGYWGDAEFNLNLV